MKIVSWAALSFLSDISETDITGLNQVSDMDQEFNSLITRFSVYDHQQASNTSGRVNIVTSTPVRLGARTATDKYSFLPCKDIKLLSYALKRVRSVFYFWNRKSSHKDDYQLQLNEKK